MAIDFPNSPSVGDTHEGFTYSTTGWTRTSSSGESSGGLTVYATPVSYTHLTLPTILRV